MTKKNRFLKHIHYFRAFAIINIVIIHTWRIPSEYKESQHLTYLLIETFREVSFHDSTIYFVFISGFLFHYLSPRFELIKYYKSKIFNVIFPYIFMTSLVLFKHANEFTNIEYTLFFSAKKIFTTFVYGKAQIQYWYIPFISLVFLISPLLLKIPKNIFYKVVIVASILPLLGTRTNIQISIWQYIYFLPIYLQGIYVSMNYNKITKFINMKKKQLFFISIISSILLIYLQWSRYHISIVNITESLYYIQKLSICFLIIITFQKFENKDFSILNNFATYSFAIYFTHLLVGNNLFKNYYYHFIPESSLLILPASILYVVIVTFTTLFFCMSIKKILGHRSRYFIGA